MDTKLHKYIDQPTLVKILVRAVADLEKRSTRLYSTPHGSRER